MEPNSLYKRKFDEHKICVIVPTFNNSSSLKKVIDGILDYTTNLIVVNDGSTDGTEEVLKGYPQIRQIGYEYNVGKGWALRQGFNHARKLGFEYAITIDSDGQHFPEDLPKFIDKLVATGPALFIGARNMEQTSVPGKSSFGNKFSNFWFWVETGQRLPDTQSGYRMYPIGQMKNINFFTKKFEFEIEVIVRSAWRNIKIEPVPVSVYYAPPETRVSHFRPVRDFFRISVLNTILVIIAFAYIKPRDYFRYLFSKSTYEKLRHQIIYSEDSRIRIAASVSFGIFMGIIPIWGFQLIVAIFLAILLKLNKAVVIICAHISIPPMIPVIIFLSYKMGALWMGEDEVHLLFDRSINMETIRLNFIQYLYGSITLAVVAALLFGFLTYILLGRFKKNQLAPNE